MEKGILSGRGDFIGEPRRTACTECVGDKTVIPDEAWARDGKEIEEMDTGIPRIRDDDGGKMFGKHRKFTSWIGYVADQIERRAELPTPEDELIAREQERCNQCRMCEEGQAIDPVKAAFNLMAAIEVEPTPEMCFVVGAYIEEDMKSPMSRGMDGVIRHYFQNANGVREAVLEFIFRLKIFMENEFHEKNFVPEFSEESGRALFDRAEAEEKKDATSLVKRIKALDISSNAKAQMIAKAQLERRGSGNGGPAYKLGEAIFGSRWKILLRATV